MNVDASGDINGEVNVKAKVKGVRRRRSWYRRRLRLQRAIVAIFAGAVVVVACWQNAARYLSLPSVHSSQVWPSSFGKRTNFQKDHAVSTNSTKPKKYINRVMGVYPYSVVPGGLKNPNDLRSVAMRDSVVRRHYADFDFDHAHLVRATEAQEVYLSYRIRDTVFWTRKKVRLHTGELLLTDGKITARARCGNQISESAKPEVSEEEPAEDVLDQPVAAVGAAPSWPLRPSLPAAILPTGQPTGPQLYAGGFFFPYIPYSVAPPSGLCRPGENDAKCHKHHKPPTAPEPSTMFMLTAGLGLVMWRYRKTYALVK